MTPKHDPGASPAGAGWPTAREEGEKATPAVPVNGALGRSTNGRELPIGGAGRNRAEVCERRNREVGAQTRERETP